MNKYRYCSYPFNLLSEGDCDRLKELGAVRFTASKNYTKYDYLVGRKVQSNEISSIHFYSSKEPNEKGEMTEVAFINPELYELTGKLNEVSRQNFIDVDRFGYQELIWREE